MKQARNSLLLLITILLLVPAGNAAAGRRPVIELREYHPLYDVHGSPSAMGCSIFTGDTLVGYVIATGSGDQLTIQELSTNPPPYTRIHDDLTRQARLMARKYADDVQFGGVVYPGLGTLLAYFHTTSASGHGDSYILVDIRTSGHIDLPVAPPRTELSSSTPPVAMTVLTAAVQQVLAGQVHHIGGIATYDFFRNSHAVTGAALADHLKLRAAETPVSAWPAVFSTYAARCLCDIFPNQPDKTIWEFPRGFTALAQQIDTALAVDELFARSANPSEAELAFRAYRQHIDQHLPAILTFSYGEDNLSDTWAQYRLNASSILATGYLTGHGAAYIFAANDAWPDVSSRNTATGFTLYNWRGRYDNLITFTARPISRRAHAGPLLSQPFTGISRRDYPPAMPQAEDGATPDSAAAITGGTDVDYFFDITCGECMQVSALLDRIQQRYPTLVISRHNLKKPENIGLLLEFYQRHGVPKEEWQGTLILFVGDHYFRSLAEIDENLDRAIATLSRQHRLPDDQSAADSSAIALGVFSSFDILSISLAGLADGINPCAFGVLIFFFTYLRTVGKSKQGIILTAIAFALGIYLAYLFIGLGLLEAVYQLSSVAWLAKAMYPLVTLVTAILSVYTFIDYINAVKGATHKISLKLPAPLVRATHYIIRHQLRLRWFIPMAFFTGIIVSILELACTGQIYFPVIMYIAGMPELTLNATAWLMLYVTMFTLPLVFVFGLVYFSTHSLVMARLSRQAVAPAKLLLFIIFTLLTVYLGYISFHILAG